MSVMIVLSVVIILSVNSVVSVMSVLNVMSVIPIFYFPRSNNTFKNFHSCVPKMPGMQECKSAKPRTNAQLWW